MEGSLKPPASPSPPDTHQHPPSVRRTYDRVRDVILRRGRDREVLDRVLQRRDRTDT